MTPLKRKKPKIKGKILKKPLTQLETKKILLKTWKKSKYKNFERFKFEYK